MSDDSILDVKFRQALQQDDELGCVVRAHLHIEHLVDKLLQHHFPRAEALEKMNLEYSAKVTLLEAFDYNPFVTTPLLAIGKLRNDFAHKLEFVLSADRMDALYNSFEQDGKAAVQNAYQRTRQNLGAAAPKKMANLNPKDRFVLYAAAIWSMLVVAYMQAAGTRPDA